MKFVTCGDIFCLHRMQMQELHDADHQSHYWKITKEYTILHSLHVNRLTCIHAHLRRIHYC
jgi:hypothetical protein